MNPHQLNPMQMNPNQMNQNYIYYHQNQPQYYPQSYYYDQQQPQTILNNQAYLTSTQSQPIFIEKLHKQQFLIEKPYITREIIYQPQPQPQIIYEMKENTQKQEISPSRLRKSHSFSQISNAETHNSIILMRNSQIETTKRANIIQNEQNNEVLAVDLNEEKIRALEKQISIYRSELEKCHRETEENKRKITKYEFIIQDYETRARVTNSFSEEIERYKGLLLKKEEEIKQSRHWRKEEDNKIVSQETERYILLLQRKDEEISYLNHELSQREDLKSDISKISGYLSAKIKETEEYKVRLSEKDGIFSEIEKKMQVLMDEVERLNSLLRKKIDEVSFLNITIRDYENRNTILSQEIDRLNILIKDNNIELETWRYKYTEYSGLTLKIQDFHLLIIMLAAEIESLRSRVVGSEKEVQEMRRSNIMKSISIEKSLVEVFKK